MEFRIVAETFDRLERETARTQMTMDLVNLFRQAEPRVVDKLVYLLMGKLWPDWKGLPELGMGEKLIIKSIAMATHVGESVVVGLYKKLGDLGLVAEKLKTEKKQAVSILTFAAGGPEAGGLTVDKVYDTLARIAMATGEGSRDLKLKLLAGLLTDAAPLEARFIVRFVQGRLRLGVGDATIMDALSIVYTGSASNRPLIERAYNLRADLGRIAEILAAQGPEALKGVKPEVGIPIRPMLAERLSDPEEILKKTGGKAIVEYKYDGERGQIHKKGDKIWIFSRRLENITHMYPDVQEYARRHLKAEEAIVEGEIVAVDPETGELRPFQELMHRRRKYDIHRMMKEYPVNVRLFDVLYVDEEDYTTKPLTERRKKLEEIVEASEEFRPAEYIVAEKPEDLEKFFLQAVSDGAEGVVVKAIHGNAVYQAGSRGWLWIKYKRDYKSEMIDTVDLVAVGAFYGRGKRGGTYGALLMAAYDPEADMFRTLCKVGTGFTDEDLAKLPEMFKDYVVDHRHPRVDSRMEADVWFVPALVAEIIGAEITLSPLHTCCLDVVKPGAGLSIRFPRFIRWRPDKGPEDATTAKEILEMYQRQLRKVEEA